MLERDGGEVARATSMVRFAPGSRFAAHEHGGGEEFLVLTGVFSDESGDYSAGTYVRNPPGSRHTPHSDPGCTIFVKLRQFASDDVRSVVIDTTSTVWEDDADGDGTRMPLHSHRSERVSLVRWPAGAVSEQDYPEGMEALVLAGSIQDGVDGDSWVTGSWLRLPRGSRLRPVSPEGCVLYLKTGHFPQPF